MSRLASVVFNVSRLLLVESVRELTEAILDGIFDPKLLLASKLSIIAKFLIPDSIFRIVPDSSMVIIVDPVGYCTSSFDSSFGSTYMLVSIGSSTSADTCCTFIRSSLATFACSVRTFVPN